MATDLNFKKDGSSYKCKLDSESYGVGTIQVETSSSPTVSVSANIPGMPPSVIAIHENPYGTSVIFSLNLPAGLEITLKSSTEVVKAKWM